VRAAKLRPGKANDARVAALAVADITGDSFDTTSSLVFRPPGTAETQQGKQVSGTCLCSLAALTALTNHRSPSGCRPRGVSGHAENGDMFGASLAAAEVVSDGRDELLVGAQARTPHPTRARSRC
jgi:hypothetical protein